MTEALPFPRREFYMVRHGETESNERGVVSGDDTPLTQRGINQADALADVFAAVFPDKKKAYIVSSALPRAINTARIMVGGDDDFLQDPDSGFNERASGPFGGRVKVSRLDEIKKYMGDRFEEKIKKSPGAETRDAHRTHVLEALDKHLRKCPADQIPVIVSHQGTMTRPADVAGYQGVRFKNGGMYHFTPDDSGGWKINEVLLEQGRIIKLPVVQIPQHELAVKGIDI